MSIIRGSERYLPQAKVLISQADILGLARMLEERAVALSALAGLRALLEDPSYDLEVLIFPQQAVYNLIVAGYNTTEVAALRDIPVARVKHYVRSIGERIQIVGMDGIRKHYHLRLRTVASRITVSP